MSSAGGTPRSLASGGKNRSTSLLDHEKPAVLTSSQAKTPQLLFDKEDIYTCGINERAIFFGNAKGMVEVFDCEAPYEKDKNLCLASSRGENIMAATFFGTNVVVTGDTVGNVCVYNIDEPAPETRGGSIIAPQLIMDRLQKKAEGRVSINCLDWNESSTIASVRSDKSIKLYDTTSMYCTTTVQQSIDLGDGNVSLLAGHTKQPHCVKFIDNDIYVTAGWDDCLKLWDKRSPDMAALSINGVHVCGPSIDVRPGTDNKVLGVGSWRCENGLQLWDLRKISNSTAENAKLGIPYHLDLSKELPHDGDYVYACRFVNKNTILAGGSGKAKLLAIDIQSGEIIDKLCFKGRTIHTIAVSPEAIVAAGVKGAAKVIPL